MSDGILWGYKQIAARLGCSPRSMLDKTRLPRDRLRLSRLGGKVWMLAERADAWRRRHSGNSGDLPIVEGWLHIAKTLRVPVRTAQRWETLVDDPLPIERRRCGSVYAYRDALIDWLNGQNQRVVCGGPTAREDVCPPAPRRRKEAA